MNHYHTLKDFISLFSKNSNTTEIRNSINTNNLNREIRYLHTDSRSVFDYKTTAFVALRTELGDGHKYIHKLYKNGCSVFIVEQIPDDMATATDVTFIVVNDTQTALETLAEGQIVGEHIVITGSCGKTSLKELLYQALLPLADVVRSPRSWNSHIGVPLSLWENTRNDHNITITEVGIDAPGQAARFKKLVKPTIGILTAMNSEHDEAFENHRDKLCEKAKLMNGARVIIYDNNDPEITEVLNTMYPSSDTNAGPRLCVANGLDEIARCVLSELSYDENTIDIALSNVVPTFTRIDVNDSPNNCTTIYDRFTADIRSLRDALDFMRRRKTPNKRMTVIISDLLHTPHIDMTELEKLYQQCSDMLSDFGVERVIAIGKEVCQFSKLFVFGSESASYLSTEDFLQEANTNTFRDELILIKGIPSFRFEAIKELLEYPRHDTYLEVDLDAIIHNYNYYRSLLPIGTGLVAMVKASAYGMGAREIAKTLQSQGAAYLAVAVVDEGVALRLAGVTMPIIILNPLTNNFEALFTYNLEPTVFTLPELTRLIDEAAKFGVKDYPVHIKLDTGMHRLGFIESQLKDLVNILQIQDNVSVASVFSHLATADCLDQDKYTELQLSCFARMSAMLNGLLQKPFKRHILNTAGIMRYGHTVSHYDMARLGIGLYGIAPYDTPDANKLRPVARFVSTVISLKHWSTGTPIGYGCRSTTQRDSIIATIPVGYADGVDRHLGRGNASFIVRGVECRTIGNICMDLCMIDVTDVPNIAVGDEVEIFGNAMPIERLAETLDTIPYEILTSISPRVKRIYYRR